MDAKLEETDLSQDALISPHLQLTVRGQKIPLPSYMKFYQKNTVTGNNWILFGATEVNEIDPNPTLANKLTLQYFFPLYQLIRVEIYQVVVESSLFYAYAEFTVADLVRNPDKLIELPVIYANESIHGLDLGTRISVGINDPLEMKDLLTMQYSAEFNKKSLLTRKTYFTLWKLNENNELEQIAQSKIVKGKRPVWPRVTMKVSEKFKQEGIFRIVMHNKSHKISGHAEYTYEDIMRQGKKEFKMYKFESAKKNTPAKIKEKGKIILLNASLEKTGNFTDYLAAGLDIQCYIGLDYSEYFEFHFENLSTQALKKDFKEVLSNIGKILYPYLGEKSLPTYGIGASGGMNSMDFFPLFNKMNGIHSTKLLVEAYEKSFELLEEKKELKLTPLVNEIIKNAKEDLGKSHKIKYYTCVLLITGKIADWQAFIDEIVQASYELPLSFLLMGIGEKDFSQLDMLDQQWHKITSSQGTKPFRKNVNTVLLKDHLFASHASIKLLSAVPREIWSFSEKYKLTPGDFKKNTSEILNLFSSKNNNDVDGNELNSIDVDEALTTGREREDSDSD